MKKHLPVLLTLLAFFLLMLRSPLAAQGAREGLSVCAVSLVPSLLPFFTLSNLLSALGLSDILSRGAGGLTRRLFRVSGAGAQAFFLGLTGGYPLGAAAVASLRRENRITREEGEGLLAFCNNSGPAFILGAAGGVLGSPAAGVILYVSHVLAAVGVGILFRPKDLPDETPAEQTPAQPVPFSAALPRAAAQAVSSTLAVCGYVVLFSAMLGMLTPLDALPPLLRALCTGFVELGSGTAALRGLPPAPETLAAASFLLGWGGLSVHCQTLAALEGTDIRPARHTLGRAVCGVLAAIFSYCIRLCIPTGML